jgi:signal peptidase I
MITKAWKKTLTWLGWLIIGFLALAMAFIYWGSQHGWEFDAVLSGSMEPVFNVGGLVVIKPVDVQTLKIGDAISFKLPNVNTPVCHRIIDIQSKNGKTYLLTKGDANEDADQNLVPLSSVNGKAIFHIPCVGRLTEIKNLGALKISVLGQQFPAGTLLILGMGLLFIGITLKETLEDIFQPGKRWRRETFKNQRDRALKRKKAFKLR